MKKSKEHKKESKKERKKDQKLALRAKTPPTAADADQAVAQNNATPHIIAIDSSDDQGTNNPESRQSRTQTDPPDPVEIAPAAHASSPPVRKAKKRKRKRSESDVGEQRPRQEGTAPAAPPISRPAALDTARPSAHEAAERRWIAHVTTRAAKYEDFMERHTFVHNVANGLLRHLDTEIALIDPAVPKQRGADLKSNQSLRLDDAPKPARASDAAGDRQGPEGGRGAKIVEVRKLGRKINMGERDDFVEELWRRGIPVEDWPSP